MGNKLTAQEAGEAWLAFVSEVFMIEDGSIRPDVEEEFKRLEETDSINRDRELWRSHTDRLIDSVLKAAPESRQQLLASTDARSLAYVQDRIHCGTELFSALMQKGLQIGLDDTTSLPDYFRHVLLQKQA